MGCSKERTIVRACVRACARACVWRYVRFCVSTSQHEEVIVVCVSDDLGEREEEYKVSTLAPIEQTLVRVRSNECGSLVKVSAEKGYSDQRTTRTTQRSHAILLRNLFRKSMRLHFRHIPRRLFIHLRGPLDRTRKEKHAIASAQAI